MSIIIEATRRHDAMGVGMKAKVPRPGVQHGGHAELGMQTAAAEVEQGPRRRLQH
jgi:hypothetical protein